MKKHLFTILWLILPMSITNAFAQTQAETEKQAIAEYKQSEKELNKIYNLVLKTYAKDTIFIKKLKESQRIWTASRDADIELIFVDHKVDPSEYGIMLPVCKAWELKDMTDERTDFLNQWIEGIDGTSCEGSRKVAGDE
jgi:uncharacterized protein YecT (DUF1311 family)